MKKFWKKTEGFTLVELVVVIAILGILAGIGTVGYSGYVKKANQAADDALLSSVNTAFAVACLENETSHIGLNGVTLEYTENGPITGVVVNGNDDIGETFETLFTDETVLKYYKEGEIKYVPAEGAFRGGAVESPFEIDEADKQAYQGSVFFGIETEKLTGRVDDLAGILGTSGNIVALSGLMNDPAFRQLLIETGAFSEYVTDGVLDQAGLTAALSTSEELRAKVANASVLHVAKATQNISVDEMVNALNGTSGKSLGMVLASNGVTAGTSATFVEYALKYGVMTGFYNSEFATEDELAQFNAASDRITGKKDVDEIYADARDNDNFLDYLEEFGSEYEGKVKADASGFFAALSMINDNIGNIDMSGLGGNGFFSTFTEDINTAIGKT